MPENDILKNALLELGVKDEEEIKEDEDELEPEVEPEVTDEDLEEDDEILEVEDDEEEVDETKIEVKPIQKEPVSPTKEEKKAYAFEQLRKKAKEAEDKQKQLNEIAEAYGFSNSEEMIVKLKDDALNKKAAAEGVDPKFYKDLQITKQKLEELQRERESEREITKVNTFISRMDKFAADNGLSIDEKNVLIDNLDNDGYTLDTLVNVKNVEKLFASYVSDKIIEKEKQKLIEKQAKRKGLKEEPIDTLSNKKPKLSVDEMIMEMLKNRPTRY